VMFDSGVATKSDVLRAELESARSELAVSRAKRAVSVADNAFNMAIGANIDEPVDLNDADFKKGEMTAIKYEEFLEIARRSRPEWKIAKYGREIADMGKSIAYTGFLPVFFLTGTYGYNNVRDQEIGLDTQLRNWNIALVSSWTIFDGFATPYKVWDAYAKYTEAAKGEDLLNKKVAIEVKDAVLSLNSAVEELKSAKKAVELAEENYKIADMRYSSGIGTNLEAIDAKTMLTQARLDYLEAEFGYELAKAEVNKAVGEEVLK
jgi:outer membrane protein